AQSKVLRIRSDLAVPIVSAVLLSGGSGSLLLCTEADSRRRRSRPSRRERQLGLATGAATKSPQSTATLQKETERINMKRREFLTNSAIFGTMAVFPFSFPNKLFAASAPTASSGPKAGDEPAAIANPLKPPDHGSVPVAFVISENTVII